MYFNSSNFASDFSLGSKKEKMNCSENYSQKLIKRMTNYMQSNENLTSSRDLSSQKRNQVKNVKMKFISSIGEVSLLLHKEINDYKKIIEELIKSVQKLKEEKRELNSLNRKLYEIIQFKEKSSSRLNTKAETKNSLLEINKSYISSQFAILLDDRDDIMESEIEKHEKSEKNHKVPILNLEKAQRIRENQIKAEQEKERWLNSDSFSLMQIIKKQDQDISNLSKSLEKEILENKKLRIEKKMLKNKRPNEFPFDKIHKKKMKSHFSETRTHSIAYKTQEDEFLSSNKESPYDWKSGELESENDIDLECSSGLFEIKNKFRNDVSCRQPKFISPVSKTFTDDYQIAEAEDTK